jgi:prenyl protein peptidase
MMNKLIISCNLGFQSAYTTLFGAYAAFLFAKTGGIVLFLYLRPSSHEDLIVFLSVSFLGHFVAPFAAHSFCNHMGFPDLSEIAAYKDPLKRAGLLCLFVIGLVAWCFLLTPMTHPSLFNNNLFWTKHFV